MKLGFRLILILMLSLVACTRPKHTDGSSGPADQHTDGGPHIQGGQDGGGGQTEYSTPEQVKAAFNIALQLATEPDLNQNVFVRAWVDYPHTAGAKLETKYLFPKGPSDLQSPGQTINSFYLPSFDSPALKAFASDVGKMDLPLAGNCPSPDPKDADASVSHFALDGKVCFSLGNLTKTAPYLLLQQILGLMLHEIVHLGGGPEDQAQAWQKLFTDYYAARFGQFDGDRMLMQQFSLLKEISNSLAAILKANDQNSDPPKEFYVDLGVVETSLRSLPDFADGTLLNLAFKPKHPELVNNYSNSLIALISEIDAGLYLETQRTEGILFTGTRQEIRQLVFKITEDYLQMTENFAAYLDGHGVSICVSQKKDDSELPFRNFLFDQPLNELAPPTKCDTRAVSADETADFKYELNRRHSILQDMPKMSAPGSQFQKLIQVMMDWTNEEL